MALAARRSLSGGSSNRRNNTAKWYLNREVSLVRNRPCRAERLAASRRRLPLRNGRLVGPGEMESNSLLGIASPREY
jgi:hypothetical protein